MPRPVYTAASASAAAGLARWCRPMQDHAEVLRVNVKQQQRQTCRSSGVRGRRRSPTERVARSPAFSQAAPAPSAARTSAGVEGSAAGRVASCEDESLMCHAHARERTRGGEQRAKNSRVKRWATHVSASCHGYGRQCAPVPITELSQLDLCIVSVFFFFFFPTAFCVHVQYCLLLK